MTADRQEGLLLVVAALVTMLILPLISEVRDRRRRRRRRTVLRCKHPQPPIVWKPGIGDGGDWEWRCRRCDTARRGFISEDDALEDYYDETIG